MYVCIVAVHRPCSPGTISYHKFCIGDRLQFSDTLPEFQFSCRFSRLTYNLVRKAYRPAVAGTCADMESNLQVLCGKAGEKHPVSRIGLGAIFRENKTNVWEKRKNHQMRRAHEYTT